MFKSVKSLKSRFKSSKRAHDTSGQAGPSMHPVAQTLHSKAGNGNGASIRKIAVPIEQQTIAEARPPSQASGQPPSPVSTNRSVHSRRSSHDRQSHRSHQSQQSAHSRQSQLSSSSQQSAVQSPTRPPRPLSSGVSEATYPEAQVVSAPAARFSRTPSFNQPIPSPVPPAYNYNRHNVRYSSYGAQTEGPPVIDSAWFVPVAVLDKTVYPFEYQFGGTIGEGGFGKVLLGLNLETRQQYAIKVVAIRRLRSRRETSSVANEIKALWRVSQGDCPFLARPARVRDWFWQYRGNIHLVMEYYKGGDLARGSDRHPELRDPRRFKLMVAEIVIAILCLHDMQIIHHDVKPSNILVDTEGHCILSDYGGSCEASAGKKRTSWMEGVIPIFTVRYAAPELLLDGPAEISYGTAADFWSLGATLFELATGRDLVDEVDDDQAVFAIREGRIDFGQLVLLTPYPGLRQFVSAVSRLIRRSTPNLRMLTADLANLNFIQQILNPDPIQRLQGHDVKSHEYFAEFSQSDWTAIYMKQRPPFRTNKQLPVNPRNTSYDFVDRPGERLLDDANEEIVCRWLAEDGVGLPHHRDSDYHRRHRNNARVGLPELARRQADAEHWSPEVQIPTRI